MLKVENKNWLGRGLGLGVLAASLSMLVTGCGSGAGGASGSKTPVGTFGALTGNVHGGQQPIADAQMFLYAAGTTGYSSAATSLLTVPVFTDANGDFNITGDYTCTANQELYIVALGGNPGGGVNNNSAIMAALGLCSSLTPATTTINMNEVTTVGAVTALAPFMSSYSHVGSSATNTTGLALAFLSSTKLVNFTTGVAKGAIPAAAVGPTSEVNTLGDILATCVNSQGGVAGDSSACGKLFALATPPGGTSPTDTIQAALNIAQHPTLNVAALFDTASPSPPFIPELASAPNDWTLSIVYAPPSLSGPVTTTIDAGGKIWIANSTNDSVTVLYHGGIQAGVGTGNGLSAPDAIAFDTSGNAWVANKTGNSLSVFTNTGGVVANSPFNGNGLASPSALAMDAFSNVWVTNSGANTVSEFTTSGAAVQELTTGITTPTAIAINPN
jgi:streptogramin lyase